MFCKSFLGYLQELTLLWTIVCLPRLWLCEMCGKMFLPDRESNPGLPRDRRRSLPLDYRGLVRKSHEFLHPVHYSWQKNSQIGQGHSLELCRLLFWCKKILAPGEARTHNPGIPHCTVYKYRALTDCATGANQFRGWKIVIPTKNQQKIFLQGVGFEPTQSFDYESLNLTP